MAGKVIGRTLDFGYAGNIARGLDTIIQPYPVKDGNIRFGEAVVLNDDNTVSHIDNGHGGTIIGFAARKIGQPKADKPDGWYYEESETCEVMVRGAMTVHTDAGDILPRDEVLIDLDTGGVVNAAAGRANTEKISGAYFTTGRIDANGITEVVLTQRMI